MSGFWLNSPSCFCEIWICHVVTIIAIQYLKHFTVTICQVTVQLWLNGKWSKRRKNYNKHMWVYTVNLQWQSPKIYSFTLSKEVEQYRTVGVRLDNEGKYFWTCVRIKLSLESSWSTGILQGNFLIIKYFIVRGLGIVLLFSFDLAFVNCPVKIIWALCIAALGG